MPSAVSTEVRPKIAPGVNAPRLNSTDPQQQKNACSFLISWLQQSLCKEKKIELVPFPCLHGAQHKADHQLTRNNSVHHVFPCQE